MDEPRAALRLLGAWRLETICDRSADGRTNNHPDFGLDPDGLLLYTASGHVSVQFMKRGRPLWSQEDMPTEEERTIASAGYGAYAGRFDVDEAQGLVRHHVEVALIPNRVGTTLIRRFSFSGDRLTLAPLGARYQGTEVDRTLTWRRLSG